MTSFNIQDLIKARNSLEQFRAYSVSPYHERYSFPFLLGTYFAYRKIDVLRLVSISKAISDDPKYVDVGCGYGDFLNKVREFLGNAIGIEKDARIFYNLNVPKPNYIRIADARWEIEEEHDIIFVGWMDPGVDFTDAVAAKTNAVVTTLDQGISQAAEFEAHGFSRIAYWRTPSWEDVNTEIMNRYYTKMSAETRRVLFELRGAHNLWYVYSKKPSISRAIKSALLERLEEEKKVPQDRYDFEDVLDECGFMYLQGLHNINNNLSEEKQQDLLWDVKFVES